MGQQRISWYRVKADKAQMKALQQRSDAKGLLQAGSQLAVVILTGWLCFYAYHHWSLPLILLAFFVHGTFFAFLSPAAACHELSHGTPFKTKALNEFFYNLFAFLSWTNPVFFRVSHTEHHQNTLHDEVDQEVVLPAAFGWFDWIRIFTFSVAGAPRGIGLHNVVLRHASHACGRLYTDWEHRLFDETPKKKKELIRWGRILVLGHLALAALFIYLGQWILIPIVVLPFYATWLGALVGLTQHAGLHDNVPDFRKSCRSVKMGWFNRWCYWNMNYHIEHHMYAAVPFHALPKLNKLIAHDLPKPNSSLADALSEIRGILKKQKADPTYQFDNFSR